MKIEMEGGATIEFHNNEGNAEVYTGCTIFPDEAINEELFMENGIIVELDDTQPKDEPKAHDDTAPLKVYAILETPEGVNVEVPIDNFTKMGNTKKGFKKTW